tara:strand:+ start:16944 stop:17153 length:210 start_codon:yes stop_codon:yes gene_type:complete
MNEEEEDYSHLHIKAKDLKDLESYNAKKLEKKYKGCFFSLMFGVISLAGVLLYNLLIPVLVWIFNFISQ